MDRVLCRAQPWGRWGQCLEEEEEEEEELLLLPCPQCSARGASPAGAGDRAGAVVSHWGA